MGVLRADCERMDAEDPLAHARARFRIPESVIYLDGNSLGALPRATPARLAELMEQQWGRDLIRSWNAHDWINLPARVGARIAPLIGAESDEVIAADSTSVNLFKLAAAALSAKAPRRVILSERGNFPTDLYVLQGLKALLGDAVELRLVAREEIGAALDETVALLVLTHIHYKTGAPHDMRAVTEAAHRAGALTLWDLSHSAGAVELFLDGDAADFAIGCGYKYLNGGPGAPAFLYVARRHQRNLRQPLSGWMGHEAPFELSDEYRPAQGMLRTLCGTPSVLAMTALAEGVATFDGIAMRDVHAKSKALGNLFLALVDSRCAETGFEIACPRDPAQRGSQVSLRHPQGYAIMQALIAQGVIGDFRAPDILRFGFAPLYTRYADIWTAVDLLSAIMRDESWREPRFQIRAAVT
ncbi:MAG TPA: kynureninase [Rhizomicrobium sp.]|jgi:kynureninase|nr:kynureninase [Rhizomicrobium sp.]